jgi:hypothetical protein
MFFVFSMTASHQEEKLSSATKSKVSINNTTTDGNKEKYRRPMTTLFNQT